MQDGKKSPQVAHRLPFLCHVPKPPLFYSPLLSVFRGISEGGVRNSDTVATADE